MSGNIEYRFSERMKSVPVSFLSELFRVSQDPSVISFAGGLPASESIDVEGIRQAAWDILGEEGRVALQYSTTDGYLPLRQYIAERYRSRLGLDAIPGEIQIVNGSQQCLDLVAKIFLSEGDHVGIERPGYLGAIEAFSLYQPKFHAVPFCEEGPDCHFLERIVHRHPLKFFYGIPNSQNPSGRTYSVEVRREISRIFEDSDVIFYEDDAFGELFFDGRPRPPVKRFLPDLTLMSGSFSKVIAPGMRIGWMYAPSPILAQFNIAKQAADLHTNLFSQMVLYRYLSTTQLDEHIRKISRQYGERCKLMCDILDEDLPTSMDHTVPEGGMFLMATLPPGSDSLYVFHEGIRHGVAVLPGIPFYLDEGGRHTIRLNFSHVGEEEIKLGMERLVHVLHGL